MCHSPLTRVLTAAFLHLYAQFYYIFVAVTWHRVRAWYVVRGMWSTQFLRCCCSRPSRYIKFDTKVVIETVAKISRGSQLVLHASRSPDLVIFGPKVVFDKLLIPYPSCVPSLKSEASTVAEVSGGF